MAEALISRSALTCRGCGECQGKLPPEGARNVASAHSHRSQDSARWYTWASAAVCVCECEYVCEVDEEKRLSQPKKEKGVPARFSPSLCASLMHASAHTHLHARIHIQMYMHTLAGAPLTLLRLRVDARERLP